MFLVRVPKSIRNELEKMMTLTNINIINYIVTDNELIKIDNDVISMSKSLVKLKNTIKKMDG